MGKIKVRNSGTVKLPSFDDFPDGVLIIGEGKKNIPFNIKRFYHINDLFNKKAVRGKHAHKKTKQIIFCVNGSFDLILDDGEKKQKLTMKNSREGIILGKMLWHTMENFSKDCAILVVANDYYKANDYIRDYAEFKKLLKNK